MNYPRQLAEECAAEINRRGGRALVSERPGKGWRVIVWSKSEGVEFRDEMADIVRAICRRHDWSIPEEVVT